MSSDVVLVLWDPSRHGTPKSFSDVIDLWNNLEDVEDSPSERILAFAQQVQEQALKNPEDYEDFIDMVDWIGEQTTALIEIDLPTDDWQRPLVLLAEAAMACKLVGIAESLILAFLPNGKILPTEQVASWKGLKAFLNEDSELPRNITQYKKLVEPMYDLLFNKYGYTKKKYTAVNMKEARKHDLYYYRSVEIGHQEITYSFQKGGYEMVFFAQFHIQLYYDAINEIYAKFGFKIITKSTFNIESDEIIFANYNRVYSPSYRYYDSNPISREKIDTDLAEMEQSLFPFLDQASDIKGLDKLLNGDVSPRIREKMHRSFYIPHCLILARLAGNPHFEELVTKFEELSFAGGAWGANSMAKATELPKLVKYLREEVKPLV